MYIDSRRVVLWARGSCWIEVRDGRKWWRREERWVSMSRRVDFESGVCRLYEWANEISLYPLTRYIYRREFSLAQICSYWFFALLCIYVSNSIPSERTVGFLSGLRKAVGNPCLLTQEVIAVPVGWGNESSASENEERREQGPLDEAGGGHGTPRGGSTPRRVHRGRMALSSLFHLLSSLSLSLSIFSYLHRNPMINYEMAAKQDKLY